VDKFPLFPLPETVVFPGMTLPLFIFEERYKQMIKDCVDNDQRRIAIVLAKPQADISDVTASTHVVGSVTDILSVSENPDGTYYILVHGQERCRIGNIDNQSRTYLSIDHRPYKLERGDPNVEQVTAWDAIETFREYAKVFFTFDALKQIEDSLPEELIYQASFICANIRIPAEERQILLEAPSLIDRFRYAQKLMRERIAAHDPANDDGTDALNDDGDYADKGDDNKGDDDKNDDNKGDDDKGDDDKGDDNKGDDGDSALPLN
jgi:ATP-dependent Lon protease